MMNETVAFDSLLEVTVTLVDTSLFQTTSLFEPIFFRYNETLIGLDLNQHPVDINIG